MTHGEFIKWLFSDTNNIPADNIVRKFTTYFHRSFYDIPFVIVLLNEYTNDINNYHKSSDIVKFYKYLIKNNRITQSKLTNIFPKKKKLW